MYLIPGSSARAHDSLITLTVLNAGAELRCPGTVEKHARRHGTPRSRDAA